MLARFKFTGMAALLLVVPLALWGQGQSAGNSQGSGNTGSTGSANRGGNQGNQQNQRQGNVGNPTNSRDPFGSQSVDPFANQPRPLYLQGRVVTSDGQPPNEPVVIQRVCNGSAIPEGYTDVKGRFSFRVGGDMAMLTTDASVSGAAFGRGGGIMGGGANMPCVRQVGLGRFDLSSSTLRAQFTGYRSDEVHLGMYSTMGKNDVGIIVLHRLDGLGGNTVSALTLQAPKGALKAYQSGLREMRKGKPNFKKSIAQLDKAVKEYPQFAAAWAAMGDAKLRVQDESGAREAFHEALKHDPKYLKPYEPLMDIAMRSNDWEGMASVGSSYLELNPHSNRVRFLTAVASLNTDQYDRAEELVLAIRAGSGANNFPRGYLIMGMIHERRMDFDKAADQYRAFFEVVEQPEADSVQQLKRKLHEWQMLGVISRPESTAGGVSP